MNKIFIGKTPFFHHDYKM